MTLLKAVEEDGVKDDSVEPRGREIGMGELVIITALWTTVLVEKAVDIEVGVWVVSMAETNVLISVFVVLATAESDIVRGPETGAG